MRLLLRLAANVLVGTGALAVAVGATMVFSSLGSSHQYEPKEEICEPEANGAVFDANGSRPICDGEWRLMHHEMLVQDGRLAGEGGAILLLVGGLLFWSGRRISRPLRNVAQANVFSG